MNIADYKNIINVAKPLYITGNKDVVLNFSFYNNKMYILHLVGGYYNIVEFEFNVIEKKCQQISIYGILDFLITIYGGTTVIKLKTGEFIDVKIPLNCYKLNLLSDDKMLLLKNLKKYIREINLKTLMNV